MELGIPEDYGAKRRMTLQVEAWELIPVVASSDGRMVRLAPAAASAWKKLRDAASGEGIVLEALSGFRSIERQREIIEGKLAGGETIEVILLSIAAPGYSEHHTGRALDIGTPGDPPLTEAFARTAAFRWLDARAYEFGFVMSYPRDNPHGIAFEPWHWCHHDD